MKLYEIYDDPRDTWLSNGEQDDVYASPDTFDLIATKRHNPRHRYMGSGSNAYVGTDDIENFGDVERISDTHDGTVEYLTLCLTTPELRSNPFCPRVRRSTAHGKAHEIQMERLLPFNTSAIIDNKRLMTAIISRYMNDTARQGEGGLPVSAHDLCGALNRCMETKRFDSIKDARLRRLCEFIVKEGNELDYGVDIHTGNLMWRMAPYQPQLVIVDPWVS